MSSTPFFSLATYFASRKSEISGPYLSQMPPRPKGTVIWVWATDAAQIGTLRGLESQLSAEGDQITFVITLPKVPDTLAKDVVLAPANRPQTQTFLTHWLPNIVLWMRDGLEPAALVEIGNRGIPCILVEATAKAAHPEHGGWVPGLTRAMLQHFAQVLAVDADSVRALIKAGANPSDVQHLGLMESAPPALPHFEDDRQEMSRILGARPVWLAVDSSLAECDLLAEAHHHASLRSHRLLLIITLRDEGQGPEVASRMRDRGYLVALRSAGEDPDDATQIYVADYEGELGLWYRIAPITYLGNSLSGGPCRNPIEAATLGSAIIHGPDISPYQDQIKRLQDADACISLRNPNELGREVERVLAPDIAALLVHGAWEVTSRGAETTSRVVEILLERIDALGS